jgi:2-polyprenyl-3-methyl-5-hydroxy-6-metoxy-1,4-benzoquinol methylase
MTRRFKRYILSSILDVGCSEPVIPEMLNSVDYTGVDVSKDADIQIDLEDVSRLPFKTDEFETVVCTDTLEHLDNLHNVFDELVRVAQRNLIVSLPNNWVNARVPIQRGRGDIGHYGLPIDPPEDRHKWFFSLSEAARFFEQQTKRLPISLVEMVANEKPRPFLVRRFRRMRFWQQPQYLNRYAHTLWGVFKVDD